MTQALSLVMLVWALSAVTITQAAQSPEDQPLRLAVDLVDGSHVVGLPSIKLLPIQTAYAAMNIPLKRIRRVKIEDDHKTAAFELRNGDKLQGILNLKPIQLETVFGVISIRVQDVTSIHVHTGDPSKEGLVLHYSFDRDEGDRVLDKSDWNRNGKIHGAKWTKNGKTGGGMRFDGNAHISAGPLDLAADNSWLLWIKLTSVSKGGDFYIFSTDRQHNYWAELHDHDGDGKLELRAGGAETSFVNGHFEFTEESRWYHLAVVVEKNGKLSIYVNGELDKSDSVTTGEPGSFYLGERGFEGTIDNVMIFDHPLSEAEIKRLYSSQKQGG
jgi:hypothetical protein